MPLDALSTLYGDDCLKCRKEPRLENQRWGEQCLTASRRWREQYVAEVAKEDYTYISYHVRHAAPPPPPARARRSADESLPASTVAPMRAGPSATASSNAASAAGRRSSRAACISARG